MSFLQSGYGAIALSVAVVAIALAFSQRVVRNVAQPMTSKPYAWNDDDWGPLVFGAVGMLVVGYQREAGVWSYFIDLASFTVAASLVATCKPRTLWRRLGLVIIGVHGAQVLATNSNAPLNPYWASSVGQEAVAVSTDPSWLHVGVAAAVVFLVVFLAREAIKNKATQAKLVIGVDDVASLAAGFAGMVIGMVLQHGKASVWDYAVDIGALSLGALLFATAPLATWPRRVGALMIGLHMAQVLVTDLTAPLHDWAQSF